MRMYYGFVRYLGISNQVPLTWTMNTSFAIAFKNRVSIFNTQSFNKRVTSLVEVNIYIIK